MSLHIFLFIYVKVILQLLKIFPCKNSLIESLFNWIFCGSISCNGVRYSSNEMSFSIGIINLSRQTFVRLSVMVNAGR